MRVRVRVRVRVRANPNPNPNPKPNPNGGQVWAGAPAKQVGTATRTEGDSLIATASLTADLGTLHMDEAWKDLMLVDQEQNDEKRQR